MSGQRKRLWAFAAAAAAAVVVGWFAYYYAQSPVGSGVYPARLGGTMFIDGQRQSFDLPVIWVRPHPWAELPPEFHFGALVDNKGQMPHTMGGTWRPVIEWEPRTRPAWLQPRAVQGKLRLPVPEEGMTVQGVRWQMGTEPERYYRIGAVDLRLAPPESGASARFGGGTYQFAYPHTEPGKEPEYDRLIGHYLYLDGSGKLVDLIPSLAGTGRPISGLRYREGTAVSGLTRLYYEDPEFRPLTLPLEFNGTVTIYIPLPPEAQERMADTYFLFRPAAVVLDSKGLRHTLVSWYSEAGLHTDRKKWRYWVPYFIYE